MEARAQALGLYRRILRAHRARLPHHLRQLGDAYVREEFKKHKAAASKFLVPFYREWNGYVDMLERQSPDGQLGQDLSPDVAAAMTDEQRQQLHQLKVETETQFKQT